MNPSFTGQATLYRFRYAAQKEQGGDVAFAFSNPVPRQVVGDAHYLSDPPTGEASSVLQKFEILVLPSSLGDDKRWREGSGAWMGQSDLSEAHAVRVGKIHVAWRRARSVIVGPPAEIQAALEAVVDFTYYENELGEIEKEIADDWTTVEADIPLAYDIAVSNLLNDHEIGRRVGRVLRRRVALARMEPHLYRPPGRFSGVAGELGEAMREAGRWEERAEIADGQIEAQEYVYEMASQRFGEFRHARQGFILELMIVALLAAEVVLMLIHFF